VAREVVFAPEARDDLRQIYRYVAAQAGAVRALGFTERIISYCEGFAMFPERGTQRDDLRPGLRIIGFERRVTIAFHLAAENIVIDRVLYSGRDLSSAFEPER
jgi:toxin ParE1/3/4